MLQKILIGLIILVQLLSCSDEKKSQPKEDTFSDVEEKKEQQENIGEVPIISQPYKFISSLKDFKNPGDNWIEVGEVTSNAIFSASEISVLLLEGSKPSRSASVLK